MNKKTFFLSLILIFVLFGIVFAQDNIKVSGTASKGGKIVRVSANTEYKLMETYPQATVTIYNTGTLTLSSIYNDEAGTSPKSNPFTANTDASYSFYIAPGRYDIKFSGTGILTPFTISDFFVATGGGGGGSGVDSFNGRIGIVVPVDGDYTFTGLNFTGSNFNSIVTRSASDLNAGTIPDSRFPATLPAISGINLTNLNASNITLGTLADARLSTNVPLLNAANTFTANNFFTGAATGAGTTTPRRKLDVLDPSNAQLRLSAVDNSVYTDLFVDSGGSFNIIPTGNIAFDATGNQVNPLNNYDQNLGQVNKKYLSLHAAELVVETLVAQNTVATIGGRIIVAPTNQLIADLAPATTTINVKYNNFNNGDRVYMEGGGQVEFFAITSGASVIAGGFSYTVTRNLDGTGANQWYAGDAMVNTGVSGNGFIDLYSIRGVKSGTQLGPTIVGNVRNSSTYNDWTENWAIGNLNGLYGYGSDIYGAALGKYAAGFPHITVDGPNGIRIFSGLSTIVGIWDAGGILVGENATGKSYLQITSTGQLNIKNGAATRVQLNSDGSGFLANSLIAWDTSGNLTIQDAALKLAGASAYFAIGTTPPTSSSSGTGIWIDRTGIYSLNSNVVRVKIDATGILNIEDFGINMNNGTPIRFNESTANALININQFGGVSSQDLFTIKSNGNSGSGGITKIELWTFDGTRKPTIDLLVGASASTTSQVRMYDDTGSSNFGGLMIGSNTAPTKLLDISGDTIRLRTAKTPASASATCSTGEIVWDSGFVYVCVATDTWKRAAIATW